MTDSDGDADERAILRVASRQESEFAFARASARLAVVSLLSSLPSAQVGVACLRHRLALDVRRRFASESATAAHERRGEGRRVATRGRFLYGGDSVHLFPQRARELNLRLSLRLAGSAVPR